MVVKSQTFPLSYRIRISHFGGDINVEGKFFWGGAVLLGFELRASGARQVLYHLATLLA
jgi:hypothetical protein